MIRRIFFAVAALMTVSTSVQATILVFANEKLSEGVRGVPEFVPNSTKIKSFSWKVGDIESSSGKPPICSDNSITIVKPLDLLTANFVNAAATRLALGESQIISLKEDQNGGTRPEMRLTLVNSRILQVETVFDSEGEMREMIKVGYDQMRGLIDVRARDGSVLQRKRFDVPCTMF